MDCIGEGDLAQQEVNVAEGTWQLGLRDNGTFYQLLDLQPPPPVFIDSEWRVDDDDIILVNGEDDVCVFSQ